MPVKLGKARTAALALAALVTAGTPAWADARCARPAEKLSFDTRNLQSQLMVAALSCGQRDRYNAFVLKHRAELVKLSDGMKGYFSRIHGKRGEREMHSYITAQANQAALQRVQPDGAFCTYAAEIFQAIEEARPGQLAPVVLAASAKYENAGNIAACAAETRSADRTAKPEPRSKLQ